MANANFRELCNGILSNYIIYYFYSGNLIKRVIKTLESNDINELKFWSVKVRVNEEKEPLLKLIHFSNCGL